MNAKAKGSRRERQTIELLQAQGYSCTKSGGSLGVFDVIAVGPADILLIQCKSNRWPSSAEMSAIASFAAPAVCRRIVHRWRDRQAAPDVREIEL
jgi:Holliday junction resolvase